MKAIDFVHKYDQEKQFEVLKNSYRQIELAWSYSANLENIKKEEIGNIILTGLGGSAIGGDLLKNFLGSELIYPYQVNRNYSLPKYADHKTLLIVSSYSGNTEETIAALNEGIEKGCKTIAITTGGEIEKICVEKNIPVLKLKSGFQPRYALWINFFTLLKTIQLLNLIPVQNEIVESSIELLKLRGEEYSKENNAALNYSEKLLGHIPVIYGVSDYTDALAIRFKSQFNENSKLHSFYNLFPEMNHNEIVGWETFNENDLKLFSLFLDDEIYNERIKERIDFTSGLLRKSGVPVDFIRSEENNFKLRLIDLIYLTDWITYYSALIRAKDPSEIENINLLKDHLAEKAT